MQADAQPQPGSDQKRGSTNPPGIPDHDLIRRIGSGSYGDVWLARNVLGQFRAVKIVHRATFEDDRPFEREFEGIRRFEPISRSHPSQLNILHVGRGEGCFYYVMELADDAHGVPALAGSASQGSSASEAPNTSPAEAGTPYQPRTLKLDLKRRGRLPPAECVEIGLSLTTALAHLHKQSLVHRDIKPSNIIFVGGVPKLADIGLVTDVDASRSFVGTEGFLPPEGPGTPQADLYSLGKVLYEMSTGRDRKDYPALPQNWDALAPAEQAQLLELNEVLVKVCEADRPRRYQTAEELRADLELLQRGQSVRHQRAVKERWNRVKRALVWAGIAVLMVGAWRVSTTERWWFRNRTQPTVSLADRQEAERFYKQAMSVAGDHTKEQFLQKLEMLNQAITHNPYHAQGHAALAAAYWAGNEWYLPPKQALSEIKKNALKAIDIDPNTAYAHLWLGMARMFYDHDWNGAEQAFKQAIKLDPKLPDARSGYARLLQNQKRLLEARLQQTQAHELMPDSLYHQCDLNYQFRAERDYQSIITNSLHVLAKNPNYLRAHADLARACMHRGEVTDLTNALAEIVIARQLDDGPDYMAIQACIHARMGRHEDARHILAKLQELESLHYVTPIYYAQIHIALGEHNEALDRLEQAYDQRSAAVAFLKVDPTWDLLRSEPRFVELLRKLGLEK